MNPVTTSIPLYTPRFPGIPGYTPTDTSTINTGVTTNES